MKEHRLVGASLILGLAIAVGCVEPPPEFPQGTFHSEEANPTSMNPTDATSIEFADGKYFVSVDGVQLVEGNYTISNDTVYGQDESGPWACGNDELAVATWHAEGDSVLTISRVEDPCEGRSRGPATATMVPGPAPVAEVVPPPDTLKATWDRLWAGEFETDDPVAEFLTEDAVIEYFDSTFTGLDEVRSWAAEMGERGEVLSHFPFAFEESDGQIIARARYTIANAEVPDQVVSVGREVFTWVDESGTWKIRHAIIN